MIQQLLTISSGIAIGTFIEGGYFAGYISHNADGIATHGLIVCPNPDGNNSGNTIQWKTINSASMAISDVSNFDGASNTLFLTSNTHPAANYCTNLTTNGYNDWYLPAIYELDIAYANLKPTNATPSSSNTGNPYAVPQRVTTHTSGQTSVTQFQGSATQAFNTWTWSSTENVGNGSKALMFEFNSGLLESTPGFDKTDYAYVRAFRKFAV